MIRRTYQCPDCERVFAYECNSDDPDPPCPNPDCDKVLEWRPVSFAIGGSNEGKAVKIAQKIMEQDYGMTNFRDNSREGDNSIIMRQETRAETELVEREVREQMRAIEADPAKSQQFWGGNAGNPTPLTSVTGQSMIQMAKVGPQATDPISLLQQGVKGGKIPTPQQMMRVEARSDFQNPARKAKGV